MADISLVSCFSSDFAYEIHISARDFVPSQLHCFWIFYPDGEAIGGRGLQSDKSGELIDRGSTDINWSSSGPPLKLGNYTLGIMRGTFSPGHKAYFKDWEESPNEKYHILVPLPCPNRKELIIHLDDLGKAPWGGQLKATGYVCMKDHTPSSNSVYLGTRISLVGSGTRAKNTAVNYAGKFSLEFNAPVDIGNNFTMQAIFGGDEHYTKSDSNIVAFQTVPHRTETTLEIDPLRLDIPNMKNVESEVIVRPDYEFRIKGRLNDSSLTVPMGSKIIRFENDFDLALSAITNDDGTYQLEAKAPISPKKYKIKAIFKGDSSYLDSSSRTVIFSVEQATRESPLFLEERDLWPQSNKGQRKQDNAPRSEGKSRKPSKNELLLEQLREDLNDGESQRVEFKNIFPQDRKSLADNIASFATSNKGRVYIGIDKIGKFSDIDPLEGKSKDETRTRITGIAKSVRPSLTVTIDFIEIDSKYLILISVPKGNEAVYYSNNVPYVRDNSESRPASPNEVHELFQKYFAISERHKKKTVQFLRYEGIKKDSLGKYYIKVKKIGGSQARECFGSFDIEGYQDLKNFPLYWRSRSIPNLRKILIGDEEYLTLFQIIQNKKLQFDDFGVEDIYVPLTKHLDELLDKRMTITISAENARPPQPFAQSIRHILDEAADL